MDEEPVENQETNNRTKRPEQTNRERIVEKKRKRPEETESFGS